MDDHQFKAFTKRTKNESLLKPSNIKMNTLQPKLEVKGEFQTKIRNKTCGSYQSSLLYTEELIHYSSLEKLH